MSEQGALCILLAYLLGSCPSAYLVSRLWKKADIRYLGDGNVGAYNTFREVGHWAGVLVAMLDIGKGYLAVMVARRAGLSEWMVLIVGGAAVLGHDFMLFLGFRGGQGMATTIGVLLAVLPRQTCAGLCLAGVTWLLSKHSFDPSMAIGLGSIPLLAWLTDEPLQRVLYPVMLLPVIGVRKVMYCISAARRSSTAHSNDQKGHW